MEFTHVGTHCQFEGCNQHDFLPFTCSQCSLVLCLLHRSTLAHSCTGNARADMTSLDCPICGKSIKMNKSDDPNVEWQRHFSSSCTQTPQTKKNPSTCAASNCQTILGPSNHITCNQCHRRVCLPHRVGEHHGCLELRRADQLSRSNRSETTSASKPTASLRKASSTGKSRNSSTADNTLRGTAERRKRMLAEQSQMGSPPGCSGDSSATGKQEASCPFCGMVFPDPAILVTHVEQSHPQSAPATPLAQNTSASATGADSGTGNEVCPQCSRRFGDVVELVQHVETQHGGSNSGDNKCLIC